MMCAGRGRGSGPAAIAATPIGEFDSRPGAPFMCGSAEGAVQQSDRHPVNITWAWCLDVPVRAGGMAVKSLKTARVRVPTRTLAAVL